MSNFFENLRIFLNSRKIFKNWYIYPKVYYKLISEFYSLTGVPVIINTSMNVKGEPIVNTPEQAYNMLTKTDMDCIFLRNFLVRK